MKLCSPYASLNMISHQIKTQQTQKNHKNTRILALYERSIYEKKKKTVMMDYKP